MLARANQGIPSSLNEQQLLMLRLLQTPLPENDFIKMRKLAVELLAKQLDETVGEWEKENGVTEETYEEWSQRHFRSSSKRP